MQSCYSLIIKNSAAKLHVNVHLLIQSPVWINCYCNDPRHHSHRGYDSRCKSFLISVGSRMILGHAEACTMSLGQEAPFLWSSLIFSHAGSNTSICRDQRTGPRIGGTPLRYMATDWGPSLHSAASFLFLIQGSAGLDQPVEGTLKGRR